MAVDGVQASDTGAIDLNLLQRAQRHLSFLHRVSEVLATARDLAGLADAALGTILEVTGGDRAAFVLRRDGDSGPRSLPRVSASPDPSHSS